MSTARLRANMLPAIGAAAGIALISWLGLISYAWNDYEVEALPAVDALTHGHLLGFLKLAPAYGGSLLERAPFALLPGLWGGGRLAVYRSLAAPCLLAGAALGIWLAANLRASNRSRRSTRVLAIALCTCNPLALLALELGHPEELLGAVLCVGAVLLAARGRRLWAGCLLGLAIANKEWAILAMLPVLVAMPSQRALPAAGSGLGRARCWAAQALHAYLPFALIAAALSAIFMAPFALAAGGFSAGVSGVASTSSTIFKPFQIWWFLGYHGPLVRGSFGTLMVGFRTAPAWIGPISHPAIVGAGLLLALAYWRRQAASSASVRERQSGALLLLAEVMLLRCLLDTWDTSYYMLPFLLALLSWELTTHPQRLPVISVILTGLAWASFVWTADYSSADVQAGFFLAWSLPTAALIGGALFAPQALRRAGESLMAHLRLRPLSAASTAK